jgi:hypothetical protein
MGLFFLDDSALVEQVHDLLEAGLEYVTFIVPGFGALQVAIDGGLEIREAYLHLR